MDYLLSKNSDRKTLFAINDTNYDVYRSCWTVTFCWVKKGLENKKDYWKCPLTWLDNVPTIVI